MSGIRRGTHAAAFDLTYIPDKSNDVSLAKTCKKQQENTLIKPIHGMATLNKICCYIIRCGGQLKNKINNKTYRMCSFFFSTILSDFLSCLSEFGKLLNRYIYIKAYINLTMSDNIYHERTARPRDIAISCAYLPEDMGHRRPHIPLLPADYCHSCGKHRNQLIT